MDNQYTGVTSGLLWLMTEVRDTPLLSGHTFPSKEVLLIHIAEEANLFGVHTTLLCSDKNQVNVKGIGETFLVNANYGLYNGS